LRQRAHGADIFDCIAPRSSTETLLEAALDEERGHALVGSQVEALLAE
jgi:hypothetical protein